MANNFSEILSVQQDAAIHFLHKQQTLALPEIMRVSKGFSDDDDLGSTLEFLFRLLGDRAAGAMALLGVVLPWDAEIVLRSYYECSVRILYFSLSDVEAQDQLVDEFWNILGAASDQRRARKAHFAKKIFDANDSGSRDIFALMELDSMQRSKGSLNKKARQAIEQRWSFAGMIDELDRLPRLGEKFDQFKSLLHIYGMASHLSHSDSGAIDLMLDRALRDPSEAAIVRICQCSRILTDIASLGAFSTFAIFKSLDLDMNIAGTISEDAAGIFELGQPIHSAFHQSQTAFYDSWLRPNNSER